MGAAEILALDLSGVALAQPGVGVQPALHQDPGEPERVFHQLRRAAAIRLVEPFGERVERLVDVSVAVDDHGLLLLQGVSRRGEK